MDAGAGVCYSYIYPRLENLSIRVHPYINVMSLERVIFILMASIWSKIVGKN